LPHNIPSSMLFVGMFNSKVQIKYKVQAYLELFDDKDKPVLVRGHKKRFFVFREAEVPKVRDIEVNLEKNIKTFFLVN
jgi:hypothetical protein